MDSALLPASARSESAVSSSKWIEAVDGIDRADKGPASLILSITFLLSGAIRCKLSEVGISRWQVCVLFKFYVMRHKGLR